MTSDTRCGTVTARSSPDPYQIVVLPGDGIGVDVTDAALRVLHAAAEHAGLKLELTRYQAGAMAYRDTGVALADEVMDAVGEADATLLGAMGLPDVRMADGTEITPQIDLRERYRLVASIRPSRSLPGVPAVLCAGDIDLVTVRESTEGLFAGRNDPRSADPAVEYDRMTITRTTCEELFGMTFALASARKRSGRPGKVTLLDKANVLKSMAFMRQIFDDVAEEYPEIETERLYIDAAVMLMVQDPARFDVIVTENAFGDIVSDLGAGITGGLGLAPSADLGLDHGVFQPCHGTAPHLAGRDVANPVGMILSTAMMLQWLSDRHCDQRALAAATAICEATEGALAAGIKTADVGGAAGTSEVTDAIVSHMGACQP